MHSHYGISRKCDVFLGNGNQMICTWTASIEDLMRGQSSFLWCSSARTPLSGPFHVRQLERRDLLDLGVGWRIVWENLDEGNLRQGVKRVTEGWAQVCLYLRLVIYGGERRREYDLQGAKTITKQQVTTAYLKNITCVILKMEISANVLSVGWSLDVFLLLKL